MDRERDSERIIFYYEGGGDERKSDNGKEVSEETILEEDAKLDMVDDETSISDIYAELITCRSRLTAITEYCSDVEIRLQHIETYQSVSIGLLCFVVGGFFGWLILGRIR